MMIQKETSADVQEICRLNDVVFGGPVEGTIVDAIRDRCSDALSLVAVEEAQIVGHIFFSPVAILGMNGIEAMGLGPMAVLPEYQRQGIGKALIKKGIQELEKAGCAVVVVLGHADYYPKFGFAPASQYGLKSQWEGIPDDVFMARFLNNEKMGRIGGIVRYRKEFEAAV
jgi:putative acetyltransferase